MKLSLHKANKLRKQLITEFRKLTSIEGYIQVEVKSTSIIEEINQTIDRKLEQTNKNDQLVLEILKLEKTIKKEIFKENVKTGLSDYLEDIGYIKSKINITERVLNNRKSTMKKEELKLEQYIEKMKEEESSYDRNKVIEVESFFETFDLKQLKRELNNLEDKCNEINVTTKIEIEVSDKIKEIFGL